MQKQYFKLSSGAAVIGTLRVNTEDVGNIIIFTTMT